MQLQFLGAAGTVTGSRYLLTLAGGQLLVDCGLFQGLKQLRLRNRAELPFAPAGVKEVILTHAHLDHSGYLPAFVRDGFTGRIFGTPPTCDLCRILLPDSAHLQEEEAARANRYGYSRHRPAVPLYTQRDAERALRLFTAAEFDTEHDVRLATFRYRRAGHILGAASVDLFDGHTRVVFSGDLGRVNDPMLHPPATVPAADYLVVESTYGDRRHPPDSPQDLLRAIVTRTFARGGVVVIPSFAVGRAQVLLYHLHMLRSAGAIPDVPIYIDSPMAADVTDLLLRHQSEHRLGQEACAAVCASAIITRSVEESKAISRRAGPMIIISASGMATGGRVLFHLARFAGDPRNTILLVGFQAAGTRGDALRRGADALRIHGARVPVKAEVAVLDVLSAHADADGIMTWLRGFAAPPRRTFVTHGEPVAADALRFRIQEELGWDVHVPEHGEVADLGA
jgi:metallo-beta-lactamase family protein